MVTKIAVFLLLPLAIFIVIIVGASLGVTQEYADPCHPIDQPQLVYTGDTLPLPNFDPLCNTKLSVFESPQNEFSQVLYGYVVDIRLLGNGLHGK